MAANSPGSSRGFTLIEVVISVSIAVVVFGSATFMSARANEQFRVSQLRSRLNTQTATTIDRICDELAWAGRDDVTPTPVLPFGNDRIDFRRTAGTDADGVLWDNWSRISLEMADGELDDGVDNNGNELVDERQVILTRDLGLGTEQQVVLCSGVAAFLEGEIPNGLDDNGNGLEDEQGLSLVLQGDVLTVRLTMEGIDHPERRHAITHQTSIIIRN